MVKKTYIVCTNENGKINKAVKFVDDQRPSLNISERYATIYEDKGCTFTQERKTFKTSYEGNNFFNKLKKKGFYVDNEAGEIFISKLYNSMY